MSQIVPIALVGNDNLPNLLRQASEDAASLRTKKTPKKAQKSRAGKGGQAFTYVNRSYVKQWLDTHYPIHNIQVLPESAKVEGGYVSIAVRLDVVTPQGATRSITMYGAKEAIISKETGQLSLHPYFKSAETDAIKRCAAWLGCAFDIYGEESDEVDAIAIPKEDVTWFLERVPLFNYAIEKGFPVGNVPLLMSSFLTGKVTKAQIVSQLKKYVPDTISL